MGRDWYDDDRCLWREGGVRRLQDTAAPGRPGRVVVLEMSALTFMDSRGLNVLLRLHAAVRRQGGVLVLAARS
jgi:anti-anti-sigma factor